jgi:transcriptional regulator with XRE-family HTH domain
MSRFVMSKTPWERCPYPGLKAALEKTDYNQTTLAEVTGISATNVSRYIKGDVDVTVRAFLALEDITGKPFRELFGAHIWRDAR